VENENTVLWLYCPSISPFFLLTLQVRRLPTSLPSDPVWIITTLFITGTFYSHYWSSHEFSNFFLYKTCFQDFCPAGLKTKRLTKIFSFGSPGVWTQGLTLARQASTTWTQPHPSLTVFETGWLFLPRPALTMTLQCVLPCITGITGAFLPGLAWNYNPPNLQLLALRFKMKWLPTHGVLEFKPQYQKNCFLPLLKH
jgi:hypothetical protein